MHAGQIAEMAKAQNTKDPVLGAELIKYSAEVFLEHLIKPIVEA